MSETVKEGVVDTTYGGVVRDISQFPAGTTFLVTNGGWRGRIVEKVGGKFVQMLSYGIPGSTKHSRVPRIATLYPPGDEANLFSVADVKFPDGNADSETQSQRPERGPYKERKTLSLGNGKYTIVYDATGSYPELCLLNGLPWRSVTGDDLIFHLCAELEIPRRR